MSLYERLKHVKSEEDVKDAYIKALGLKGYSKNLIDIQTKEIWFEAKDTSNHFTYAMFTQLLHYVQQALNNSGEYVASFISKSQYCTLQNKYFTSASLTYIFYL